MDSGTLAWIFLGIVVLWKIVAFIRSATTASRVRVAPASRGTDWTAPPARGISSRIESFPSEPKTNRYGELED